MLDLKRKENNAKVLAVKVQIQSMLSVLYQLRDIKDTHDIGPDGTILPRRFQTLMDKIAQDIIKCGSDCDSYVKKSIIRAHHFYSMIGPPLTNHVCVGKYLKSYIYEARLAEHASRFLNYEMQITHALVAHTSLGVDQINGKLDEQGTRLREMESKILDFLRRLDTPKEKEIRDIIKRGGGPMASITNDRVLRSLLAKSGEDVSIGASLDAQTGVDAKNDVLEDLRQNLIDELAENTEEALKKNLSLFEGKIQIQNNELQILKVQGQRILDHLSGGHDQIQDADIRKIWETMGWKRTVKARHFVLALRDHFINSASKRPLATPQTPSHVDTRLLEPPGSASHQHVAHDDWAISYISLFYLQAISESIDDDGSGFITIEEVNSFTTSRPKEWSLLQWLAYWAAGWHSSLSIYTIKIHRMLNKLHKLRETVRADNLRVLDEYLHNDKFYRLELLLRCTIAIMSQGTLITPELAKLRDEFITEEERRIQNNLENLSYTIDNPSTVLLLTGPGRIERFILPLIYLLLKHDVKITQLAQKHILHSNEYNISRESIGYVFEAFDARLHSLSAIFQQMHINPGHKFNNFAYGIFETSYGFSPTRDIAGYSYVRARDSLQAYISVEADDVKHCVDNISVDVLRYGPQYPRYPSSLPLNATVPDGHGLKTLRGAWAGRCMSGNTSFGPLLHLEFGDSDKVMEDGFISGTGNLYTGPLTFTGRLTVIQESPETKYAIDLVLIFRGGKSWYRCTGVLDNSHVIHGDWYKSPGHQPPSPGSTTEGRREGRFLFSRTPAPLVQFRYDQKQSEDNRAQARWRFACNAVRYQVKCSMLSKDFVMGSLRNGMRCKELMVKCIISEENLTSRSAFAEDERQELAELEGILWASLAVNVDEQ
ncbi:hypothetical protein H0H87_002749 [Tephrocybe sp. NHM501043]|nr:hypothetical protein H0H87_002749 [Tephrocybe sp. NHM501043]